MKNLDLNLYCVQEMNEQEMLETDGGLVWFVVAAVIVLCSSCTFNDNRTYIQGDNNQILNKNTTSNDSIANGNKTDLKVAPK